MDTHKVLEKVEKLTEKFVVIPTQEEKDLVTLWIAGSWIFSSFDAYSRLYFRSTEPASGKSKAMQHVLRLAHGAEEMVQPTPATIYRTFEAYDPKPVLGIDEVDLVFGRAGSSSSNTNVLQILNKGYENGGYVLRARGQNDVQRFDVYGPVVMAGLGILPSALFTRCITVNMRKPIEGETFTPYRRRVHLALYEDVRESLSKWSSKVKKDFGVAFPDLPEEVKNRDAELYEPLIEIADAAGGEWPERARKAAVYLVERGSQKEEPVPSVALVKQLKKEFAKRDRVPQADVAKALGWNVRTVGKVAREMEMPPVGFRLDGEVTKGFRKQQFEEVFSV